MEGRRGGGWHRKAIKCMDRGDDVGRDWWVSGEQRWAREIRAARELGGVRGGSRLLELWGELAGQGWDERHGGSLCSRRRSPAH